MTHNQLPQYFNNDLQPVKTDATTLKSVLSELRAAVRRGIDLILTTYKAPNVADIEAFGSISYGALGIALMFLRLESQAECLTDGDDSRPDFRGLAYKYLNLDPVEVQLTPGRLSPLCQPLLGAVVLRILAAPGTSELPHQGPHTHIKEDIAALYDAVKAAVQQNPTVERHGHSMGIDEALLGRAGLLWALLNIRKRGYEEDIEAALQPVIDLIPEIVETIINAGKLGAAEYVKKYGGAGAFPLMWPWLDDYYGLGAMHGITGILTILLSCNVSELNGQVPLIGQTITAICHLSTSHIGHLPMSIPPYPSSTSRHSPLVQICHGAPSLLLLLGAARRHEQLSAHMTTEWDEAIQGCTERIWDEGLLSKGGGLCHGIAGNAWPWLILAADAFTRTSSTAVDGAETSTEERGADDEFLSRALAFLLHARETPPLTSESRYRVPDHSYSLLEGLSGTICAWSEACVLLTARLRLMELDEKESEGAANERYASLVAGLLGFPGLGGVGALGLL